MYADWLVGEATQLGGIGPDEADRIWDRHVLDSLLFARGLSPDATVLDVGSGVGLPGVPIAIVYHGLVTLLDRSGRRVDALHRVCSVLDIDVVVVAGDVDSYSTRHDRIVLRASLTLAEARVLAPRLCAAEGELWFGLGRGENPRAVQRWRASDSNPASTESLVHAPSGVLDSAAWLLRMTPV